MNDARAEGFADHGCCYSCGRRLCLEDAYWFDDLAFCDEECAAEYEDGNVICDDEYESDYLIDGVGFADPGGRSALRAATKNNPRNLPCPTCGRPNALTPLDEERGYQCDRCADRDEGRMVSFADY
jgi:hypothetical protein